MTPVVGWYHLPAVSVWWVFATPDAVRPGSGDGCWHALVRSGVNADTFWLACTADGDHPQGPHLPDKGAVQPFPPEDVICRDCARLAGLPVALTGSEG